MIYFGRIFLWIVAALAPATAFAQTQKTVEKPFSIVLVHGAFVDASGWKATYDLLTQHGYEVLVVQNSTLTLTGDVDATRRVIARARHPVVLVGHSYGGAVITLAGNDPKVRSLVYIAAFAPDDGETVLKLATQPVPGEPGPPVLPPSDGQLMLDPAKFPEAFAAGADPTLARFLADEQVPWGTEAAGAPITSPAWRAKPSAFMITANDRIIPPTTLRMMARRAGGTTAEIASSHAVMLTHPREVAAFIEKAASAAGQH